MYVHRFHDRGSDISPRAGLARRRVVNAPGEFALGRNHQKPRSRYYASLEQFPEAAGAAAGVESYEEQQGKSSPFWTALATGVSVWLLTRILDRAVFGGPQEKQYRPLEACPVKKSEE